jgi:hypothetical protein
MTPPCQPRPADHTISLWRFNIYDTPTMSLTVAHGAAHRLSTERLLSPIDNRWAHYTSRQARNHHLECGGSDVTAELHIGQR